LAPSTGVVFNLPSCFTHPGFLPGRRRRLPAGRETKMEDCAIDFPQFSPALARGFARSSWPGWLPMAHPLPDAVLVCWLVDVEWAVGLNAWPNFLITGVLLIATF